MQNEYCFNKMRRAMLAVLLLGVLALPAGAVPGVLASEAIPAFEKEGMDDLVGPLDIVRTVNASHGKVVVVNFWASWCPPCRVEIPELKDVRRAFSENDLYIMGVSVDDDHKAFTNFVPGAGFNYPVRRATDMVASVFGVESIPRLLVYDTTGLLVFDHEGTVTSGDLTKAIRELLEARQ